MLLPTSTTVPLSDVEESIDAGCSTLLMSLSETAVFRIGIRRLEDIMSSSTSARSEVEGILETLDNSQDGIKAFTRAALSSDPSQVVQAWRGELSRRLVIAQDPLPLVYACNDVLQESKGAKHEEYRQKFAEILGEDFKAVLEEKPALRKQVDKVISIWAARHVFEKSFLRKLRATVFQEDDVE